MKTDIKTLLEFAGVDTTKGKAKKLIEIAESDVSAFWNKISDWEDDSLRNFLSDISNISQSEIDNLEASDLSNVIYNELENKSQQQLAQIVKNQGY